MSAPDPETHWCALLDAARRLLDEHDLIGARSVLREAMAYSDKTWGKDDVHLIRPLRLMAESLWREHDPLDPHNEPELGCLQQALALARLRLSPDHLEVGRLAGEVGRHLVIAGRLDEGCALMLECVQIADESGSENFTHSLQTVAQVRMDQARPAEALPLIERVAQFEERRDPSSVIHAIARYHYGRCLCALGRHQDAMYQLQLALGLFDAKRAQGNHASAMNEIMEMMDRIKNEMTVGQTPSIDDAESAVKKRG